MFHIDEVQSPQLVYLNPFCYSVPFHLPLGMITGCGSQVAFRSVWQMLGCLADNELKPQRSNLIFVPALSQWWPESFQRAPSVTLVPAQHWSCACVSCFAASWVTSHYFHASVQCVFEAGSSHYYSAICSQSCLLQVTHSSLLMCFSLCYRLLPRL